MHSTNITYIQKSYFLNFLVKTDKVTSIWKGPYMFFNPSETVVLLGDCRDSNPGLKVRSLLYYPSYTTVPYCRERNRTSGMGA